MTPLSFSVLTICGLEEIAGHGAGRVTHVLSILDPEQPDPEAFTAWDRHHRTVLRFHDIIEPQPGLIAPEPEHVAAVLRFGQDLAADAAERDEGHLLVHCHAGVSRSTAAMVMLLAQALPDEDEQAVVDHVHAIREKAWPNLRMIAFADEALGRDGRLSAAVTRLHKRQLAVRPQIGTFMRENGRGREVDLALAA